MLVVLSTSASATMVNLNSSGEAYIRSIAATSDDIFDTGELLLGRVAPNDWIRSVMAFDLSSIPDGATINSVSLSLTIGSQDGGTVGASTDSLGTQGVQLFQLTGDAEFDSGDGLGDFSWNDQSWGANNANAGGDDTPWTNPGGDFDSTVISFIGNSVIPIKAVTPGTVSTLPTSAAFTSAIASNLGDDTVQLLLRTPGIETGFNERKLIRFTNTPTLSINYTAAVPEPQTALLFLGGLAGLTLLRRRL